MIKGRDIVVTGLQNYNISIGSNCVNIVKEFAKHNRVLYVNYPLDRITSFRNSSNKIVKKQKSVIKGDEPSLYKVQKNIWVLEPPVILESISKIKSAWIFDILNKINNKRYATEINKVIYKLNFKDFILFEDGDIYRSLYLKELIKPNFFVYYSRDRLTSTPYYKNHGVRLESEIMKKADLVCCNSEYLAVLASEHNSNSKDVGQGCDTEMFNADRARVIPNDIADIKRPIIGYAGALKSSRLDIELIEKTASTNPNWSIVLVGPEDEYFLASNLHNLKNVYFTGSKPINELPQYISAFDVALNPQHINEITIGNYPRKIDEYLVLGKKVVAIKTETMKMFADYVYLAKDADEYIEMISKALEENNKDLEQLRINFSKEHTWENNVAKIYKKIEQTINR